MSEASASREEVIARRVMKAIDRLNERHRRLRRTNTALLVAGIFSSALSTLITGITAASGPIIGEGIPGWRMACTAGAVFSFGTTVSLGLDQRLKVGERLAETRECAGRLRALDVALTTDSRSWHDVVMEYEEIVKAYPDLIE